MWGGGVHFFGGGGVSEFFRDLPGDQKYLILGEGSHILF